MGTITVTDLGKAYKQYPTRWARLAEWSDPRSRNRHTLSWVLKNISFEIRSGEALGIIGLNGAGKSTLLKMIVGTTQPTTGSVHFTGRVAALLELGMGFHPEFTGRQNAFMAGQLLGHTIEEMQRLMPEIEAFAEIGDYIDHPVRVYSSGMQVRLAFSVATAIRPDVLIIDEALSVGDTHFQHKSFERIRLFRAAGTTLLIVSHDKQAIQSICDRAILLSEGGLAMQGEPEAVMDYYNALLARHQCQAVQQSTLTSGRVQTTSGTGEATVTSIEMRDRFGVALRLVSVGQLVCLRVTVAVHKPLSQLVLGYGIKDRLGQVIYGTNTHFKNQVLHNVSAGAVYDFQIHFAANLGPGTYSIQTALVGGENHLNKNYEWRDLALIFKVISGDESSFIGSSWIDPTIQIDLK